MKAIFLGGTVPPVTGGEYYQHRLYEYVRSTGIPAEMVDVGHIVRQTTKRLGQYATIPFLGTFLVGLVCWWRLRAKSGLLIVNHYFARELLMLMIAKKVVGRSRLVLLLMHYDYYSATDQPSYAKTFTKLKERLTFSLADKIVTISQDTRKEIVSAGGTHSKVEILRPGCGTATDLVAASSMPRAKLSDRTCHLLFVGYVCPRKGIDHLIDAVSQLAHLDLTLHIVGDDSRDVAFASKLKRMVRAASLSSRVVFHGRVSEATLTEFYRSADLLVLPSLKEGFGMVLLEAMLFGLPIVATSVGAIPELVENGSNGLLVPPEDPAAIAHAIERLATDQGLQRRMGAAGRVRAQQMCSWTPTEQAFRELVLRLGGTAACASSF